MSAPVAVAAPIPVWRGDTLSVPVRLWSDAARTMPVSWSSYGPTVAAQLRPSPRSGDSVPLTVTPGAAANEILLGLTAAQTAALGLSQYGFDVQVTSADGATVTTLVQGSVAVSGDYTR